MKYTPELTAGANCTAVDALGPFTFTIDGGEVHVHGLVMANPIVGIVLETGLPTLTQFEIELPVKPEAGAFDSEADLHGHASLAKNSGIIIGNHATQQALVSFYASSPFAGQCAVSFSYSQGQ